MKTRCFRVYIRWKSKVKFIHLKLFHSNSEWAHLWNTCQAFLISRNCFMEMQSDLHLADKLPLIDNRPGSSDCVKLNLVQVDLLWTYFHCYLSSTLINLLLAQELASQWCHQTSYWSDTCHQWWRISLGLVGVRWSGWAWLDPAGSGGSGWVEPGLVLMCS